MRHEDKNISSVGDFLEKFKNDIGDYNGPIWFRGQSNSEWHLEPRLYRENPPPSESHLLNRFKQNAELLLDKRPRTDFEWLFLMQHHSISTRLLDWSESPLVAIYFSISKDFDKSGALWVLLPTVLNEKCNYRPAFEHEIPSFDDEHLVNYLPDRIAAESKTSLFPIAAIAPRNSTRMQAQQGVFTISHRENHKIEEVSGYGALSDHVWRYLINSNEKNALMRELQLLGFSKFTLFPELTSLSEIIK
jgi:hypothetical protein